MRLRRVAGLPRLFLHPRAVVESFRLDSCQQMALRPLEIDSLTEFPLRKSILYLSPLVGVFD